METENVSSGLLWPGSRIPIPGTGPEDLRCALKALKASRQYACNQPTCLSRKELGSLSVDLAATPKTGLVCRASPCLKKDEPHPILPFITTSLNLTKDVPHVLIFCSSKCKIGYHSSCWIRTAKQQRKKTESSRGSKQTCPCPTPDCHGFVLRVKEQ